MYKLNLIYNVSDTLQNESDLLSTLSAICKHDHSEICCDLKRFFFFMLSAISNFTKEFQENTSISQSAKLQLLRKLLEDLKTLHVMRIMHCNIRSKNMLIIFNDSSRASLCNYDKVVEAKTFKVTTTNSIFMLAFEI
jgi:serine/threonine protein kinase